MCYDLPVIVSLQLKNITNARIRLTDIFVDPQILDEMQATATQILLHVRLNHRKMLCANVNQHNLVWSMQLR